MTQLTPACTLTLLSFCLPALTGDTAFLISSTSSSCELCLYLSIWPCHKQLTRALPTHRQGEACSSSLSLSTSPPYLSISGDREVAVGHSGGRGRRGLMPACSLLALSQEQGREKNFPPLPSLYVWAFLQEAGGCLAFAPWEVGCLALPSWAGICLWEGMRHLTAPAHHTPPMPAWGGWEVKNLLGARGGTGRKEHLSSRKEKTLPSLPPYLHYKSTALPCLAATIPPTPLTFPQKRQGPVGEWIWEGEEGRTLQALAAV